MQGKIGSKDFIMGIIAISVVLIGFTGLVTAQYYDDPFYYDFFYGVWCLVCNVIGGIIVVATAVWVYSDARSKVGPQGKISKATPITWVICIILLWIICFPWYLLVRGNLRNHEPQKGFGNKTYHCKHCGRYELFWVPRAKKWFCRACKKYN